VPVLRRSAAFFLSPSRSKGRQDEGALHLHDGGPSRITKLDAATSTASRTSPRPQKRTMVQQGDWPCVGRLKQGGQPRADHDPTKVSTTAERGGS
jgi:hypothetical protein